MTDAAGFTRTYAYDVRGLHARESYEWVNPDASNDVRQVDLEFA